MEAKRNALGRGLSALIPAKLDSRSAQENDILLSAIRSNPVQPRESFDESAIAELAESIRLKGVLQPLVVREVPGGYELIAGERRLRAAQRAGLERVPVVIREAHDGELLELALIENLQREDLNPLEEARAYRRLIDELHLTQEQVAQRVAKDRSTVANMLRLLHLPDEVQAHIARGRLSAGHARALVNLGAASDQAAVARDVINRRLSVRDTEHLVRKRRHQASDADHRAMEEHLTRALGTKVRIQLRRSGRGKIEMHFYSLAELNGLADRITGSFRAATNF